MAKRFFFVSAGVLCLMVAVAIGFRLGASRASATNTISFNTLDNGGWVLDNMGQVWRATSMSTASHGFRSIAPWEKR